MFLERYLYKVFRIHVLLRSRTKFTAVFRVGSGILEIDFLDGKGERGDERPSPIQSRPCWVWRVCLDCLRVRRGRGLGSGRAPLLALYFGLEAACGAAAAKAEAESEKASPLVPAQTRLAAQSCPLGKSRLGRASLLAPLRTPFDAQ